MPEMLRGTGEKRWRRLQDDTDGERLCRDLPDVLEFRDARVAVRRSYSQIVRRVVQGLRNGL
jgi:hypothetical protein